MDKTELKYSFKDLRTDLGLNDVKSRCDKSSFDILLGQLWESGMENGLFRYKLSKNCLAFKVLPGKFRYVAQLNPDRAAKRREPQEIQSVNQPFNHEQFNFNKVKAEEVLLKLTPYWEDANDSNENLVLINVSPMEYGHVLLTPFRNQNRPQRITREGLRLAMDLVLLSDSPDIRVGFNSLCGFASVNHEHWHAYYLPHRLYLENAPLTRLVEGKNCFVFENEQYPPGFCFILQELKTEKDLDDCLKTVIKLVAHVQDTDVAHNVYITRGSTSNKEGHFDSIRIYFWARTSSYGAKGCDAFNPALCELAGHFSIKNEELYKNLTEEFILNELHSICDKPYSKVKQWICPDML